MKSPRAKGAEFEKEVVSKLQSLGVEAKKAPLTGTSKNHGDIWASPNRESPVRKNFPVPNFQIETKRRKRGFKTIYDAIEKNDGNDILIIKDDRKQPLFVLPEKTFNYFLEESKWGKQKEG